MFQLRQKQTMCCLIMFSTLFITLISVLGSLVFVPMSEKAMSKYDWPCMQDMLKQTSFSGPAISVGSLSEKT